MELVLSDPQNTLDLGTSAFLLDFIHPFKLESNFFQICCFRDIFQEESWPAGGIAGWMCSVEGAG